MNSNRFSSGSTNTWLIVSVIFIITTLAALVVMAWALINYLGEKGTTQAQVDAAVAAAQKEQADADEAKFVEREKDPNREFVGPEDYGSLSFKYPKTWSVFVEKDASTGSSYQAYFHPITVPPVSSSQRFALRLTIESKDYDRVVASYQSAVGRGDLRSSAVKFGDQTGTRLEGQFSRDIRGSAVVFKLRDKTATLRIDADTFKNDFNKLVSTIKFNQ